MKVDQPTLFDLDEVPRQVTLRTAREIALAVVELEWNLDTFYPTAKRIATRAERAGAFSIARLVRWVATPAAHDRHGPEAVFIYADERVEAWLARLESQ